MDANSLLILLTTGPEDRGSRATLAFSMAVTALISGVEVTIYTTMGGTFWSRENSERSVHIDGFEPLRTYVGQFLEAGGKLQVCSPCEAFFCAIADGMPLRTGAVVCGLAHIVDLAMRSSVVTL